MSMQGYPAGKRAFRAWVRAHHPDLGGDPEAFAEGLRAMAGTDDGAAVGAGTTGSGHRLPAPAGESPAGWRTGGGASGSGRCGCAEVARRGRAAE